MKVLWHKLLAWWLPHWNKIPLPWQEFLIMAGAMCLQYFLVTINIRACAQANYVGTLVSDGLVAANGYILIKRLVDSKTLLGFAGYVLGGMLGSQIGITITKMMFHK